MQVISGALTETGASDPIHVEPGETFTAVLTVADAEAFEGTVIIERSRDGVNYAPATDIDNVLLQFTGPDMSELTGEVVNTTIQNTDTKRNSYRVRATVGADDGISYLLSEVIGDRITTLLRDRDGRPVAWARDDGSVEFAGIVLATLNGYTAASLALQNLTSTEDITSNGSTPTAVSIAVYETRITTSGSMGTEDVAVGDGTGAVIGQRKLIVLETLGDAGDDVALDFANIVDVDGAALTAATLDAAGGFVLLEWNGTAWQVIYSGDATITPA